MLPRPVVHGLCRGLGSQFFVLVAKNSVFLRQAAKGAGGFLGGERLHGLLDNALGLILILLLLLVLVVPPQCFLRLPVAVNFLHLGHLHI